MNDNQVNSDMLSERQRKFIAFVICSSCALLLGCLLAGVVFILNRFFEVFSGVIWSLAVSVMLAILLRPIVTFFEDRFSLGRITSILLLYGLVVLSAGSATWFLGGKVISQTREFVGSVSEWPDKLESKGRKSLPPETWEAISGQVETFKEYWKNLTRLENPSFGGDLEENEKLIYDSLDLSHRETVRSLDADERKDFFAISSAEERKSFLERKALEIRNRVRETIEKRGEQIAEKSAEVLKGAWSGLVDIFAQITFLAVIPIYLFYFLSSNRNFFVDLDKELGFLSDSLREDFVFLIREFVGIMVAFFRGQLIIGLMMGVGYAIGFSLSGLKFGITLGLLFGLLNIVPYLGSIVGIITTLCVAYLQPGGIAETGQWSVLLGCGISFVVVQVVESYFLTPRIMGQQTGLHPVLIIVSIFFWGTALGGILGMIFGIPLTAFLIVAWRLICRKHLNASFC